MSLFAARFDRHPAAMKRIPRMNNALYIGVHVGAGTDAHGVMSYNPWVALRWMLDGKTVGGVALRGSEEKPTRENALRMYMQGSACFAFAEEDRGSLEIGKLANLAVLSKDYFTVPVEEIGGDRGGYDGGGWENRIYERKIKGSGRGFVPAAT